MRVVFKHPLFSVAKKDLQVEYFSGTGAGGQYRNKHKNCVRIKHAESGALVTGQSYRERVANIREALYNLADSKLFRIWLHKKVHEIVEGRTLEEIIEESMDVNNIRVEVKDEEGKWVEWRETL